uniref:E3 ubiquitin-protein ligase n=1 Tax=Strigamia maritima TaxID=126957 RepID=T1JNI2_STRMM
MFWANMAARGLPNMDKRAAAAFLHAELPRSNGIQQLNDLLDVVLEPNKQIDDFEAIDWCRCLMSGGRTPDEFSTTVRKYDNATACGLVWTANFIAYRCRTCGVSPCMSICAECFQRGNHEGHDFNMFRSQAGGACDCGDSSVMKESGFCNRHGPRNQLDKVTPPPDLFLLSEMMMPRLFLRLLRHFRDQNSQIYENSASEAKEKLQKLFQDAESFIHMLHRCSEMGAAMRHVMAKVLTNADVYKQLNEVPSSSSSQEHYIKRSNARYIEALKSLPVPDLEFQVGGFPEMSSVLFHKTLLEELVFWTVKFEFPQKLVCLLLNMMPDTNYKDAFTRTFVQHYGCISLMLVNSNDADTLSNRVVHVSVQLFSNEALTLQMANELHLLFIMVGSLRFMMSQVLIPNTLQDTERNFNYVVDCSRDIMKDHCYWPLVSDLNNVLSHRPVALKFMGDSTLLDLWFTFLSLFQGMNVNKRELLQHVEFEPNTYYAAFSAELEASAAPMWAMISHLKDSSTVELTKRVIVCCLLFLEDWFDAIGCSDPEEDDPLQVSFHLPLHRYFAVFLSQAVRNQGADIDALLPSPSMLQLLMIHPLRAQVAFYEILCGLWVRNGLQIKGQAMTYTQCHFCNSMIDADLFLLQVCASKLDPDWFLMTTLERFHIAEWLSFSSNRANSDLDAEQEMPMLESCLTFIASLLSIRTNVGLTDEELTRIEIVLLLCMGDKTHSQLTDLMPEKCGTGLQNKNFEAILNRVTNYKAPNFEAGGHMLQGMYAPKDEIWERDYDPMYVLLRAVHRHDYQVSLDRFTQYVRQTGKFESGFTPWPPYRIPENLTKPFMNILRLLHCKTMHALIFVILYKAVNTTGVSETAMSLAIYLLEMAIRFPPSEHPTGKTTSQPLDEVPDLEFSEWFNGSWILTNVQHKISNVIINHDPGPMVHEDADDMNVDNYIDSDMEMQEIVESPAYDSRGPRGEGAMLESSTQRAALPPTLVHLALPPAQSSNALVPVSNSSMAVAQVSSASLPSVRTMALSQERSNLRNPERRRSRYRSLGIVPNSSAYSPNMALPAPQEPIPASSTSMAVLPSGGLAAITTVSPARLKLHETVSQSNILQIVESLPQICGRSPLKVEPFTSKNVVEVNESILSLLVKLHSKLSGKPDSFKQTVFNDSRVGNGPHFIGQVLNRISMLSLRAARSIQEIRQNLWPRRDSSFAMRDKDTEGDKEARRRRARERQQKLMAEFASKQKAFMEQTMETDTSVAEEAAASSHSEESLLSMTKEFDCVICGQTTPSTEERPIGLVTLLQPTSILGHAHRKTNHLILPCSNEEQQDLRSHSSRAYELNRRIEEFGLHFHVCSWLMALNIGLEGGIHVQTCGHHLHLDCHRSYIQSLKTQQSQRQQSLAIERGEYSCPLCRQLANSVMPISPDIGEISAVVQSRSQDHKAVASELARLIVSEPATPQRKSPLMTAMGAIMEDMTITTYPQYKCRSVSLCRESIFLFICSIARTNLEIEIVQRGGNLCSSSSTVRRRPCFIPLLHVLAMHSKILSPKPYTQVWAQITGITSEDGQSSISICEKEVPLLLKDIPALLLQLVLILPIHIDKAYYSCMVRVLYNVVYVQILSQLSCRLTEEQRNSWREARTKQHLHLTSLPNVLGEIIDTLSLSSLYLPDDDLDRDSKLQQWSLQRIEENVQQLCVPFLRVASLLQHYVYKEELPDIPTLDREYSALMRFLGLSGAGSFETIASSSGLLWLTDDPRIVLHNWCRDYGTFVFKSQIAARSLLNQQHVWQQPQLLRLPDQYERFFQYYHCKHCHRCNQLPKDPSVCLLCGTMVCLRESCCRQHSIFEAVQHSIDCGAGTAMFLAVNSSNVIVIRGKRVCLWGSVYLDSYGEEDKDLKRGKPLFLCRERYNLLQHQWLTHSFDHTTRRWLWHKDVL